MDGVNHGASSSSNIPFANEAGQNHTANGFYNLGTDYYFSLDVNEGRSQQLINDEAYLNSLPTGYRFQPLDEELIEDYLKKKINNQPLPPNHIKEVELYKFSPDALEESFKPTGESEWYFFTSRARKYRNGERPNRTAGNGFWKATGAAQTIEFNGKEVGTKRSLKYYRGPQPGVKTNWLMHEYEVTDLHRKRKLGGDDMKLDELVLCRIRKKPDKNCQAKPESDGVYPKCENMSTALITNGGNPNGEHSYFDSSSQKGYSEPESFGDIPQPENMSTGPINNVGNLNGGCDCFNTSYYNGCLESMFVPFQQGHDSSPYQNGYPEPMVAPLDQHQASSSYQDHVSSSNSDQQAVGDADASVTPTNNDNNAAEKCWFSFS